jgi:hypothetical protein
VYRFCGCTTLSGEGPNLRFFRKGLSAVGLEVSAASTLEDLASERFRCGKVLFAVSHEVRIRLGVGFDWSTALAEENGGFDPEGGPDIVVSASASPKVSMNDDTKA